MKQSIVKDLTTDEVRAKIGEERTSYTKMKMAHAVSPIENPMKIRDSRRAIARLLLGRSDETTFFQFSDPVQVRCCNRSPKAKKSTLSFSI